MMTNEQYSSFRKKINPIIKACSTDATPQPGVAIYFGFSSFTQSSEYGFWVKTAESYQQELINICRDLPKLKDVLPGTAGSISSLDLVKASSNPAIQKGQFEAAEKFLHLLNLAEIAGVRSFTADNGLTFAIADISLNFKEFFNS